MIRVVKKYKIVKISDTRFDSFFYTLLLLLTFITQFYTHNYETLGWDINTFIVMSQEVHRGNLPYENHFDNKGPLLYFLYAIPTYFKSLIFVKIFNDLVLALVSIQMYQVSKKIIKYKQGLITTLPSLFFLLYMSHPQGHLGMSEVYSLLFLALGIKKIFEKNNKDFYFIGFNLSLSFLVTPSTILLVATILLLIVTRLYKKQILSLAKYLIFGLISPFFAVFILYGLKNQLFKVIYTLFIFPIKYSTPKNILNKLFEFLNHKIQYLYIQEFKTLGFFALVLFFYFLFTFLKVFLKKEVDFSNDEYFTKLIISSLIVSSIISYFLTPANHWHYMIYYFFFLSFVFLLLKQSSYIAISITLLFISFINISQISIKPSVQNLLNINTLTTNYEIYNDYQFINNEYQVETILALHDHLILFYFDKIGENYIVHPSNYNKKSYIDNLVKQNFMEQYEIKNLIDTGKIDLLVCSENYFDICSSNIKKYEIIEVNNKKTQYFLIKQEKMDN